MSLQALKFPKLQTDFFTAHVDSDVVAVGVAVVGGVGVVVNIYCSQVSHALPGNDGIKKTGIMIIRKCHLDSLRQS